ncbi:hypothetical protein P154DRAFT_490438 [Amniculicola lignicola CBS 123094]|uniref:DUF7924 domain-containing protein n=1 Tax=Amniculicola lignicola CBS 123094 TaxID=1392246 RepID=A0A6A5WLU5_9PLEO|nr:hypothetical protein P154DRAFT_490438 [Amniculicola lignicola CBS 123094]
MAKYRTKSFGRTEERRSCLNGRGKSHRGIEKKQTPGPIRRTARLREIHALDKNHEEGYTFPFPSSDVPSGKFPQHRTTAPRANDRKRKRQQEPEDEFRSSPAGKKPRASPTRPEDGTPAVKAARLITEKIHPIDYWTKKKGWPKEYFEQDDQAREDFHNSFKEENEKDSWFEKYWLPNMDCPIPKKRSSSSLRRAQSEASSAAPLSASDQRPREEKSALYRATRYVTLLATKGSFMDKDEEGIKDESKILCRTLLESDQTVPQDSLFRDDLFEAICRKIQNRNEAMVIQDISRLIVPSAQNLTIYGAKHLGILIETANEGWNNSRPFIGTRPQPDYSVGFRREAFTEDQLKKLEGLVGDVIAGDMSFYMATYFMYLPFLTCEVKCGDAALNTADRQNAHSMTLAVRGVVEIFRHVKREKEVDREILAFSVSHDHQSVRIYGHYPVIKEKGTAFYRYPIRKFDFTELEGKDKWTAYKFTKNVYDVWMPIHFKRLCSVIDALPPEHDWDVPPLSEGTGLSQVFESHHLSRSNTDSQVSLPESQDVTPNTSFSQPGPFKNPRKRRVVEE